MLHYVVELALWTLVLFLVGCVVGALARQAFGGKPEGKRPAPQDEREST